MLKIKNWAKFQHYKHRNPPWIKLHKSLLDDREWFALSGDASKVLASCWLIASERDGELPPTTDLAFRLRMDEQRLIGLLGELTHWIDGVPDACKHSASGPLARRMQHATTETETETETEKKDSAASAAPIDLLTMASPPPAESTPPKSGNPPKRKAREPNLAAGDALATRDDGGFSTRKGGWLSFEEVFEDLRVEAAQRGLPYSLTGRLQSAMGNFEHAYDALKTGLAKPDPRKYVAGAIHRREAELAHEGAALNGHAKQLPGDPKETPRWILDRRAEGDVIVRDGKSWRWEGGLFDDAGNETGF